jgi:Predicted pyridoxal phosphate-dependent enzyme apparently involved in regulation of cell wall biogenesis
MFRVGKEEVAAIERVVESKSLFRVNDSLKEVDTFEREFAQAIGTEYALLVSGGTGALMAALVGLGIGPGDEVIVPGYTFMASAGAVLAVGAIPVLAEINETMTLDPVDVEKKISKNTKAIMPVHICGFPADMDSLCAIAKAHNLYILEDACQADGAKYKGKRLGSIGDVGAFSFNFFKLISAGEGGCVTTNNNKVYQRALIYHDGGAAFRPYSGDLTEPIFVGTQMRASEILGAFMRTQLTRMDGIIADLQKVKGTIVDSIKDTDLFRITPSNDRAGELATTLALTFKDEKIARAFNGQEGIMGMLPIDSGKHVYVNWTPVMEHRGGHCDAMNPFLMPANKGLNMEYSKDMLPHTLDILKRTVYISIHCDWTEDTVCEKIRAIKNAIKAINQEGIR